MSSNSTVLDALSFEGDIFNIENVSLHESAKFQQNFATYSLILLNDTNGTAFNVSLFLRHSKLFYSFTRKIFLNGLSVPIRQKNVRSLTNSTKQVILEENRQDPDHIYLSYQVFKYFSL